MPAITTTTTTSTTTTATPHTNNGQSLMNQNSEHAPQVQAPAKRNPSFVAHGCAASSAARTSPVNCCRIAKGQQIRIDRAIFAPEGWGQGSGYGPESAPAAQRSHCVGGHRTPGSQQGCTRSHTGGRGSAYALPSTIVSNCASLSVICVGDGGPGRRLPHPPTVVRRRDQKKPVFHKRRTPNRCNSNWHNKDPEDDLAIKQRWKRSGKLALRMVVDTAPGAPSQTAGWGQRWSRPSRTTRGSSTVQNVSTARGRGALTMLPRKAP